MARVLITGGSDGIGWHLATQANARGDQVIATGRRARDQITPALPDAIVYIQCDHGDPDAANAVAQEIKDQPLDLVILNAAMGLYGALDAQTAPELRQMMSVNVTGALHLAQALTPHMQAAEDRAKLVFVGSTAAKGRHADFAAYAASKAALQGAARSLRLEWRGTIDVQILHPGPTATDMHAKVGLDPGPMARLFTAPEVMAQALLRATKSRRWHHRFGLGFMLRKAIWK